MFSNFYPSLSDSDYYRALAEERLAREQYAAARRAQEEARQRAARARAARRAYASATPYDSFVHEDDFPYADSDPHLAFDTGAYQPRASPSYHPDPFAYAFNPYEQRQRALMEEQRRRELVEFERERQRRQDLLELERERQRKRIEEERIQRLLQEERAREEAARQRLLEEERVRQRKALEEEIARRERDRASHQAAPSMESLLRILGLVPEATTGAVPQPDQERPSRQPRRRAAPSPSPVRQYPFGQSFNVPSPTTDSTTTIPITTKESPAPPTPEPSEPTAEQVAAAEKIQETYRAYTSRKHALKAISALRKRFLAARAAFVFPTTLDYDLSPAGHAPAHTVTVTVGPDTVLPEVTADAAAAAPRLAYSPTNAPLHAHEEELNRILGALDAIESRGDMGVRAARRELARTVEREAERVERWRLVVWAARAGTPAQALAAPAPAAEQEMQVDVKVDGEASPVPVPEDAPMQSESESQPEREERLEAVEQAMDGVEVEEQSSPSPDSATASPAHVDGDAQPAFHKPTYAEVVVAHQHQHPPAPAPSTPSAVPEIVVEPPSRTESTPTGPATVDSAPSAMPIETDADDECEEDPVAYDRPLTPALTHTPSEAELDMDTDVELHDDLDTPPLSAGVEAVAVAGESEGTPARGEQDGQRKTAAALTTSHKSGLPSLVERDWREIAEYDMF